MDKHENISLELVEEIERFLLHRMSLEEKESFKNRMSNNPDIKQATEEMQLLFVGIQEASLEEKLNYYHNDFNTIAKSITTNNKLFPLKKWLIAASIILVIVSATLILFNMGEEETLYAEYYQPDPGLISPMSSTENYSFDRAMVDFKTGNYKEAINAWEYLQSAKPSNDTLNYFLGSALLANKQTKKAIPYFKRVTAQPSSEFISDAYWYLALAQLKEGNKKEAIQLLEKSDHPKSVALLVKLQNER